MGSALKSQEFCNFRPLQHPRWLKIRLLTTLIHSCKRIHRIASTKLKYWKEAHQKWLKVLSKGVGVHAPSALLVPMTLTVDEFVFVKIFHTNIMIMLTTSQMQTFWIIRIFLFEKRVRMKQFCLQSKTVTHILFWSSILW